MYHDGGTQDGPRTDNNRASATPRTAQRGSGQAMVKVPVPTRVCGCYRRWRGGRQGAWRGFPICRGAPGRAGGCTTVTGEQVAEPRGCSLPQLCRDVAFVLLAVGRRGCGCVWGGGDGGEHGGRGDTLPPSYTHHHHHHHHDHQSAAPLQPMAPSCSAAPVTTQHGGHEHFNFHFHHTPHHAPRQSAAQGQGSPAGATAAPWSPTPLPRCPTPRATTRVAHRPQTAGRLGRWTARSPWQRLTEGAGEKTFLCGTGTGRAKRKRRRRCRG